MQSFENRTGGLLRYLGDVKQGVTWTNGEVPTWNATTQKFEPATPSGGGGGDSIYTADGTLSGPRTVTVGLYDLVFAGAFNTPGSITIQDNNSLVLNRTGGASTLLVQNSGSNYFSVGNSANYWQSAALWLGGSPSNKQGFLVEGSRWRYYTDTGVIAHDINDNLTRFYLQGFSTPLNSKFIIGGGSAISTEDISLQSSTLIKGLGSTSATESFKVLNSLNNESFKILDDLTVLMPNLPTASTGLPTGAIWNNAGFLNIV